MKFKLASKMLANSAVYKSCQQKLLTAEIEEKKGVINEHKKIKIKQQVNPIDFAHISLIFLICNDKNHYLSIFKCYLPIFSLCLHS